MLYKYILGLSGSSEYTPDCRFPERNTAGESAFAKLFKYIIHKFETRLTLIMDWCMILSLLEKDGTISTPTIIRDEVGYGATDEVLRILKGMPSWKAGQQDGKIVRVQYTLPVKFKL